MHWINQLTRFMEHEYLGNSFSAWALALAMVLTITTALRITRTVIVYRLRDSAQTASIWDDVVLDMAARTKLIFQVTMGVVAASYMLDLPHRWDHRLHTVVTAVTIVQAGWWMTGVGHFVLNGMLDRRGDPTDAAQKTGRNMLRFLGMSVIWGLVCLLVLENSGVSISGLAAGLGVTGIAVALATQNIVGDLFASISILLDKPFLLGDFIIVDSYMGTVERIGIKTTRLRSLSGEGLIMANSDLTKSRVRNYRTMAERRIVFSFGIRYETPLDILKKVPTIVGECIDAQTMARLDRVEMLTFGESAFTYEAVWYVLDPSYNVYTSTQQSINYAILERFAVHDIQFAFRTQVTYAATDTYLQDRRKAG